MRITRITERRVRNWGGGRDGMTKPGGYTDEERRQLQQMGRRLRTERQRRGLSQARLAEVAAIKGQTMISRYETGRNAPTLHTLVRLSAALGVTPGAILDPIARKEGAL